MERLRPRHRRTLPWVVSGVLLLTSAAVWADAPRLQASQAQEAQKAQKAVASSPTTPCNDVTWLNPPSVPPFVLDVPASPTNCDFHELVYQNFFALTLGTNPAFASWPTSEQVYPATGTPNCSGAPLASTLRHRISKLPPKSRRLTAGTTVGALNDIEQATGQALVDQNGRYVQYEMRLNPQLCQVVTSCQLYTTGCVLAAINATNPQFRWPVGNGTTVPGVAELKLAWRVMETCNLPDSPKSNCKKDDLSQFFTVPNIS
ncbi:MAG TPA: hypothetical protein VHN15_11095, partial [Thermoanaerobaculia bacterium]|nr:hypothetical protein [Thermoanaerobaculia bacterium]